MNYKFKIGDPVIFREDSNDKKPFNFDCEPIYIVYAYIAEHPKLNDYDKKVLLKKGIIYQVSVVDVDEGFGYLYEINNVREDQLSLYTGDDEDVWDFYNEAKTELLKRIKEGTLRKLEYKNWVAKRTPTMVNVYPASTPEQKESWKKFRYKFNVGDIVIYKKNISDKNTSNINIDSLCIVYNHTEKNPHLSSFCRSILSGEKGYFYEISKIEKGDTFGNIEKLDYVGDDQLIKYEGKNKKVLELIKEAKDELARRYQNHSLYRKHSMKL